MLTIFLVISILIFQFLVMFNLFPVVSKKLHCRCGLRAILKSTHLELIAFSTTPLVLILIVCPPKKAHSIFALVKKTTPLVVIPTAPPLARLCPLSRDLRACVRHPRDFYIKAYNNRWRIILDR
jgi:hypothetical protein